MNQVFLLKVKCFAENLLCWKTPNHLSLSYSHREEMGCLQPLLPLSMFQSSCASPCAHSGSIWRSTHLLNGSNILFREVYEIFKEYEEEEKVLFNKRETQYSCVMTALSPTDQETQLIFSKGHGSLQFLKCQFAPEIFYILWLQTLVKYLRARKKTHSEPKPSLILLN